MHMIMVRLIENCLLPISCMLSETNGKTTRRLLRKSNSKYDNDNKSQEHFKLILARNHVLYLLKNKVKEYSQWV